MLPSGVYRADAIGAGHDKLGYRGSKLPDGRDFDPAELDAMMKRLWLDHVKKNGLERMPGLALRPE
jgi:hypothetical protein